MRMIGFSESGRSRLSRMLDKADFGISVLLSLSGLFWLLLMMIHAGPLWRDELCSVVLAEESSIHAFWDHLGSDSCPLLWPALLRIWISAGMATDLQIRFLGFLVGACLLASIWVAARWMGRPSTIVSASLVTFSPAILFTISSVRAYGLGSLMLVCTMGLTWRAVERGSPARLALLMGASLLAGHSLYTAAPFLLAILSSGILVCASQGKWKSALWMMAIGLLTAGSMVIYEPIIARAGMALGLFQIPIDVPWITMRMRQSVETAGPIHTFAWVLLILLGLFTWLRSSDRRPFKPVSDANAGVSLFCLVIMLAAPVLYGVALLRMKVPTQFWYYTPLMVVVAVAMNGLLGGREHSPWLRICRLLLAVVLPISAFSAVWQEVHTLRTNMDIAARELMQRAGPEDLIIVDPFYCVTSFERYYAGKTRWTTLPPVEDTRSGGYGSIKKAMMEDKPLQGLLLNAGATLRSGNRVWIVGRDMFLAQQKMPPAPPAPPNGPLGWNHGPYSYYWSCQLGAFLFANAKQGSRISIEPEMPIHPFEHVSLLAFSPY